MLTLFQQSCSQGNPPRLGLCALTMMDDVISLSHRHVPWYFLY